MVGIAGHAIAHHFRVNGSAARAGVLELLEDQNASSLAHDEPIAITIEGAAGALGSLVVGREGLGSGEASHS